jgi:hypothetical protein
MPCKGFARASTGFGVILNAVYILFRYRGKQSVSIVRVSFSSSLLFGFLADPLRVFPKRLAGHDDAFVTSRRQFDRWRNFLRVNRLIRDSSLVFLIF